jgi:hypothetical protein
LIRAQRAVAHVRLEGLELGRELVVAHEAVARAELGGKRISERERGERRREAEAREARGTGGRGGEEQMTVQYGTVRRKT